MILKLLEVRDRGTFIPVFAFRCRPTCFDELGALAHKAGELVEAEIFLLGRAGCGYSGQSNIVVLGRLDTECHCSPDCWPNAEWIRTLPTAHRYIEKNFDKLKTGDVIDVEFILGETQTQKTSERLEGR